MTARHVGRRNAAAGGFAMLLLAASAAGSAKAEELDGELIAAVNELQASRANYTGRLRPIMQGKDEAASKAAWTHCEAAIWPRGAELVDAIIQTPACSPEGVRAKATALNLLLERNVPTFLTDTFEGCAEDHELLARSLVRDVLGRAV